MSGTTRTILLHYGGALAFTCLAVLLRWLLDPWLRDFLPFPTLFGAVALSVWLGGYRPALVALVLGYLACEWLFVQPRAKLGLDNAPNLIGLCAYLLSCGIIIGFGEALRSARRKADASRARLEQDTGRHREAEERFRLAADAVNGIIYEYDFRTGQVERTRGLFEVLGYRPDEVPPTAAWWRMQIHPDDVPIMQQRFEEAAVSGNLVSTEYRVRHKDGRWLHVEDRAVLLKDEEDRPIKMVGCTVDVTERKRTEAERAELLARLDSLLANAPVSIALFDNDLRFVGLNEQTAVVDGIPKDVHLGKTVGELLPDLGPQVETLLRQVRATGQPIIGVEVSGETPAAPGQQRHWIANYFPLRNGAEKVFGFGAVAMEITERKQHEEQLRQAEQSLRVTTLATGVTLFEQDTDLRYLWIHNAITGYTVEGVVGRTEQEIDHSVEDLPALILAKRQVLSTGRGARIEVVNRLVGERRYYQVTLEPKLDADGRVIGLLGAGVDVTDWKASEEALRASEQRFQRFMDNSPATAFLKDEEGRYVFVNRLLERKFNRPAAAWIGNTDADLFGEADAEQYRANDQLVLESSKTLEVEEPLEDREGRRHYLSFKFPVEGREGRRLVGGMALDITERKRAEEALRRTTDQLQIVTDGMAALVTHCSRDLRYLWVSRPYAHWIRRPAEEIVGRSIRDILGPRAFEQLRPHFQEALAGQVVRYEEQIDFQGIGPRWISAVYTPTLDARGVPDGWVGVVMDLTERRRMEEALRMSEERLNLALDAARLGLWDWDVRSGEMLWNTHHEVIFGYTPGQPKRTYRDFADRLPPEELEEIEAQFRRAMQEKQDYRFEHRVLWPDGTTRWVNAFGRFHFDATGSPVRSVGVLLDVTDRKAAEEALREADRRKDEFLATLAHELRNPLAPIRNAVQYLHLKGPVAPEIQNARDIIDRQVQQMTRLVDDLLDVSRISRGKIHLQKQRVRLALVVSGAVEASRPVIETQGHQLTVTLPPHPVYVDADPTRLEQVFLNLLNNAAKYTPKGGQIVLTAERQGSDVVVSVRDNGVGIPADKLPGLFEMFSQVEGSLSRSQGGLGIGLHLVKRLVEMHGGSVTAHSDGPGKGSEFVVRLPVLVEASGPLASAEKDEAAVLRSSLRILIVDDNRDGADSLGMMLRLLGNDTRTAYDGEEAVSVAGAFRPDVILLDIGLPKLNGYQACRHIRGQPWGKTMVLIAVTGWGQDEDRRRSHEAGFDHHLVKPVNPQELMKLLAGLTTVKA